MVSELNFTMHLKSVATAFKTMHFFLLPFCLLKLCMYTSLRLLCTLFGLLQQKKKNMKCITYTANDLQFPTEKFIHSSRQLNVTKYLFKCGDLHSTYLSSFLHNRFKHLSKINRTIRIIQNMLLGHG